MALDGLTRAQVRKADFSRLQPGYRIDAVTYFPRAGQYCLIDDKSDVGLTGASEDRRVLPPEMRAAGAYRSPGVFWGSGFPGGK